ncbi:TPA: hypothetical protein N0F65_006144 [Lagenidium giganteum]|uniref:Peptidase M13 C-terminal domain-containing protein n=1 Tax=Lagenidium giganteum TaxID=4803 RepID=A0AAV2Z6C7_9STRA|nr:TPA: hypothetical protein N0F65_006144 [Lagenidium giganteum]
MKYRDAASSSVLALGPRSPSKARVNDVAMNSPPFAETFGCPSSSPMNPPTKCAVW